MEKTTEEKILCAAEKIFVKNGFDGTKMRDIADEAGVNLALINYYFGSKNALFETVMTRALIRFRDAMLGMVHDEATGLEEKLRLIVHGYSEMLEENPLLPSFVMSAFPDGEENFSRKFAVDDVFVGSSIQRQLMERGLNEEQSEQFLVNMFSLLVGSILTAPMSRIVLKKDSGQMKDFLARRMNSLTALLEAMVEVQKNL